MAAAADPPNIALFISSSFNAPNGRGVVATDTVSHFVMLQGNIVVPPETDAASTRTGCGSTAKSARPVHPSRDSQATPL